MVGLGSRTGWAFFPTTGGSPYGCRCKTLTAEPYECMLVVVGLPLLQHAFEEVFGADAINAQLRDFSGFTGHGDETHWQVEQLDGKSVG
jgi:hypothetical protein